MGIYYAPAKCGSYLAVCKTILNEKKLFRALHDLEYSAKCSGVGKNFIFKP